MVTETVAAKQMPEFPGYDAKGAQIARIVGAYLSASIPMLPPEHYFRESGNSEIIENNMKSGRKISPYGKEIIKKASGIFEGINLDKLRKAHEALSSGAGNLKKYEFTLFAGDEAALSRYFLNEDSTQEYLDNLAGVLEKACPLLKEGFGSKDKNENVQKYIDFVATTKKLNPLQVNSVHNILKNADSDAHSLVKLYDYFDETGLLDFEKLAENEKKTALKKAGLGQLNPILEWSCSSKVNHVLANAASYGIGIAGFIEFAANFDKDPLVIAGLGGMIGLAGIAAANYIQISSRTYRDARNLDLEILEMINGPRKAE